MRERAYYIETFGCQMNEQDSRRLEAALRAAGCRPATRAEDADILIVNTCSIRRKAEEKAYSLLGRFRVLKGARAGRVIAVGGCVAQQEGPSLLRRMPHVDFTFGPRYVPEIWDLVERWERTGRRFSVRSPSTATVRDLDCPGVTDPSGLKAYITVMEGCDNFCTYCIVPYVRGRERSRPYGAILEEARRLLDKGVKEITLLGQNVNAYRAPERKGCRFEDLLKGLDGLPGLERLRFTTSHPKDLTDPIIGCFGRLGSLCEHIHLPVQSGSDRILEAMKRGYSRSEYLEKVRALRERSPGIAITSDMIVGFPGEDEKDFGQTLDLLRAVRFDGLFSFKFSPRPGTRAARMEETVSEEEKRSRLRQVQALQQAITLEKNRALEGRIEEVLVEGRSRDGRGWMGRTRTNRIVNFTVSGPGEGLPGRLLPVRIVQGCQNSLRGRAVVEIRTEADPGEMGRTPGARRSDGPLTCGREAEEAPARAGNGGKSCFSR